MKANIIQEVLKDVEILKKASVSLAKGIFKEQFQNKQQQTIKQEQKVEVEDDEIFEEQDFEIDPEDVVDEQQLKEEQGEQQQDEQVVQEEDDDEDIEIQIPDQDEQQIDEIIEEQWDDDPIFEEDQDDQQIQIEDDKSVDQAKDKDDEQVVQEEDDEDIEIDIQDDEDDVLEEDWDKKYVGDHMVGKNISPSNFDSQKQEQKHRPDLSQNRKLKKVVKQLKELNLYHIRLLYAERLFKECKLTRKQKVKMVERLDNASTVKRIEKIYQAYLNTFKVRKKDPKKEATIKKENLNKSKNQKLTKKVIGEHKKRNIINSDYVIKRAKQLAGISQ